MLLVDETTGEILAERVEFADSFWTRFRGLMFRFDFDEDDALLFEFYKSRKFRIHTFFVFFPIDLIYLDQDFKVVEVEQNLSPWRFHNPDVRASCLAELYGGRLVEKKVRVGDEVKVREK